MAELDHFDGQPENPFATIVEGQRIARIDSYTLESGVTLQDIPIAYKTWGKLNAEGTNCLVICHAFTGSADAQDWWGPLFGPGKAFDAGRFFIFCANSLGSPYGSASACTLNPATGLPYGPEFPLVTVRDDVALHRKIIDSLGVKQIAIVVGGSMGGMLVLEWAYYGSEFVKTLVPVATSAQASAWNISWGETQRQSIYCDPKYQDGFYTADDPPAAGLGAARMSALLTYRSRNSFESRFGRKPMARPSSQPYPDKTSEAGQPLSLTDAHWVAHNEGHSKRLPARPAQRAGSISSESQSPSLVASRNASFDGGHQSNGSPSLAASLSALPGPRTVATPFSAQSYLRYQAQKFVKRFDANCYISITRKLDTHDVSRDRAESVARALQMLTQPALVIGIESDGLFTFSEQEEIARHMPNARLDRIESPEGHDGFLLEFGQMNDKVVGFQRAFLKEIMEKPGESESDESYALPADSSMLQRGGSSKFGEVDDLTEW